MRPHKVKVVVLGSGAVGKSSLTLQYVSQTFVQRYDPTIEDAFHVTKEVDGQIVDVEILDTVRDVAISRLS